MLMANAIKYVISPIIIYYYIPVTIVSYNKFNMIKICL